MAYTLHATHHLLLGQKGFLRTPLYLYTMVTVLKYLLYKMCATTIDGQNEGLP